VPTITRSRSTDIQVQSTRADFTLLAESMILRESDHA